MVHDLPELFQRARSRDFRERCRAGRELSVLVDAGDPAVGSALSALLLDPDDTAVVEATGTALLQHGGRQAWRLFLLAWSQAGADLLDHLADVYAERMWILADAGDDEGEDALRRDLEGFTLDDDAGVRAAAVELSGRYVRQTDT